MTLSDFFVTKIRTIRDTINNKVSSFLHPINIPDVPFTGTPLDTFPSVTPAEVLKLINKSSNKSSSMDFIFTSLIKSCSMVFSEIISNFVNLSISQGAFPLKFKLAQVTPLLKKPGFDKNTFSNYRPISNLNNMSKLLERLILSRIQYHTTSFCNFNPFQSAYQRYYSIESALLLALDNIYHAIVKGSSMVLISLDLSTSFNTIDHTILLSRLQTSFGISGLSLAWFHSYLEGAQSICPYWLFTTPDQLFMRL